MYFFIFYAQNADTLLQISNLFFIQVYKNFNLTSLSSDIHKKLKLKNRHSHKNDYSGKRSSPICSSAKSSSIPGLTAP